MLVMTRSKNVHQNAAFLDVYDPGSIKMGSVTTSVDLVSGEQEGFHGWIHHDTDATINGRDDHEQDQEPSVCNKFW